MGSHGNATRQDSLKQAAGSRARSWPPREIAPDRNGILPISNQSVYSFQIVVPVVQRIEQGFPKGKMALLQEFADVIGCAQIALSKCLG
jgi:hypothetical protein